MNHYSNYLDTKTTLGLSDNYYIAVFDLMPLDDPERLNKLEALSRLITTRKIYKGRGIGINGMEKIN